MASKVFYGSPRQSRLDAKETLPAKLDLILEQLNLRERVKGETVAIKLHSGSNIGYSTIHPIFVRKVVQAIKDGGGQPFVTDIEWDVRGAESRGYTVETLGCPIYPSAGLKDRYHYVHEHPFKSMREWKVAGMIEDASFLVDFAHVKGHPSCGFGGVIKNLALGNMIGETRSGMHDVMHYDQYWFREKCTDRETFERLLASCPHQALVEDKHHPGDIHMHFEQCNQCGRCLKVAPEGSLKIDPVNFYAFQEACAISASISLSTFEPGKAVFLALATHMTPVCDCFGFTSMPILPDAGIFGGDDIVAVETAVLDMIGKEKLIEENLPRSMEVWCREGHPFAQLHGPYKDPYKVIEYAEKLGMGCREYELIDVLPVEEVTSAGMQYIPAQ
ncbi:MAG: DUF362 domain-containing protein [Chloroflexi bacterium]|nr:DUF362 domain-containing protein [Chloroflexota bacterium]